MARIFLAILFCFGVSQYSSGQRPVPDSLAKANADSITAVQDSLSIVNAALSRKILNNHPYFNINEPAVYPPYVKKINAPGKEIYFYIVAALTLLFAIFKAGFSKYFSDLTHLFFRRSLKQRQLKKQVVQNSLPSLLFNIFFVMTGGFYIALAIQRTTPSVAFPFWQLFIYAALLVGIVYLLKYAVLKFIGWVFKVNKLSDNYIFLIFLVNKILAILLLPFVIIIALTQKEVGTIAWTLSWFLISGFILYRYISALRLIRKEKSISFFHFLLYISAFEVLPTIMLYKGIATFLK